VTVKGVAKFVKRPSKDFEKVRLDKKAVSTRFKHFPDRYKNIKVNYLIMSHFSLLLNIDSCLVILSKLFIGFPIKVKETHF